ncbi:MAG: HEAT repeat domain-containing protein, partial [Planctomycetaceae bacterium]|nr:HEAT repeat domain-containing protein [Planctomycetaceae bacterium]
GGGGGGAGVGKGKGAAQDDKDKIWPFYYEGNKEEYIATVIARRPLARISPPKTSTYVLSTQPEPAGGRRLIGETDRQEAMALVVGRLSDGDSHVRDAAVLALGKSGFKEALSHIQKIADSDPDYAVREDALLAMGLSGQTGAAQPYLLKALTTPSTDRREKRAAYAALGLGLLGTPENAVEPLRKLYQAAAGRTGMEDEAACAAVALGMLGDAGALPMFEKVVASRAVGDGVKCFTLHALGRYGQHPDEKVRKAALKAVLGGLEGKIEARQSALLALGSFNDPTAIQALVKEGLGKADPYSKNYAAHALGRIAARVGPTSREYAQIAKELCKVAETDKKDKWLFQAGTLALATMSYSDQEKQLMEFVGDLKKLDGHVASAVVLSLGLLGTDSPESAKHLSEIFGSRSSGSNIQAYAGLALAMTGSPGAVKGLSETLTGDSRPHADVARTTALAIGLVGGAEEAKVLVDVLAGKAAVQQADSARFFLKGAAVQGIGLIGDAESVKLLKPVLESKSWEERAFATAALGYLMEPKAEYRVAPRLSDIFRHHNYHVALPVVKAVQSAL